jgi:hypothetical protein
MDYQKQENDIVSFIENNFNKYNDNTKIDHYINEFLDFDQYQYDNSMFFNFLNFTYDDLTNESKLQTGNMIIYIVVRNDTEKNLHKKLRDYATSFYNMLVDNMDLSGIIDQGSISEVHFYDQVEGNKNLKLAEIHMILFKEI